METIDRIFECLANVGLGQKEFAKEIGLSPSKISEWKTGKAKSYTKYLPQIAEALNTTVEYLVTGEPSPEPAPTAIPILAPDEAILLKNYRNLNPEGKEKVLDYAIDVNAAGRYKKHNEYPMGEKEA